MSCKYGERGSLTAICTNATPIFFKDTTYRFDHLDETLLCVNCRLTHLSLGSFDVSGNRIQTLNISNSQIKTIEEKAFTGLIFMEKLILSDNAISKIEQRAFFGTRKTKQLYMENALEGPLPNYVFQELHQLRELYLKNNSLAILEQNTFYGLGSLTYLDLSYNKLRIINNSLSSLSSLKVLLLNNNEIFKITSSDFYPLQNLLDLDLSDNIIGSFLINFTHTNSLKKLNLSKNHLGNEVVKIGIFQHLHNLEILDLSLNWFKTIPPKLFMGLYNLRELNLASNSITKFQSGAFTGLPNLRLINVSHNNIEIADITGKLSLRQLHVLDISENKISNFDIVKFLQRLPKITKIDLRENSMDCVKRRLVYDYLKDENIQVEASVEFCPKLSEAAYKEFYQDVNEEIEDLKKGSPVITSMKVVFLLLVILSIGLLYYVHLFIVRRK
ncbi:unnamed protein product [Ceutorhynchus assimilis]|uniref:Uncharacterized protein n=1 Tax=Ceutorhynchus assimilis TaxID=467358 RepID=A0A9N9MPL5_9CUCU|nr:unnamed protein product [Ceutorhynchus assimilis]